MVRRRLLALVGVTLGVTPVAARAQTSRMNDAAARCKDLGRADLSAIQDALTQIIEARSVDPGGDTARYCEVSGYVAPSMGFLLRLPLAQWNGKFLELGCGGWCGSTRHIQACETPLRRGYACIVYDGGHQSTGAEAKWAYNNWQAKIDYLVLASHVTAIAGKAIVERYYGRPPKRSYFMGCSAGGTHAMQQAQKFPWDFDGIVAGCPALSWPSVRLNMLWANRALTENTGEPLLRQADLDVLHAAVVARCDLNDGIKDGLIGDPRACAFDPSEVRCVPGKNTECLTTKQIEAVVKIYDGPVTSNGAQVYLPTAMRGSERTWLGSFMGPADNPRARYDFVAEGSRYFSFHPDPGPTWKPEDFDFDHDYKRLGLVEGLEPANPDLRRFEAAGGKLLMYTGWNDALEGVLRTVDYYETAETVMGGRVATQQFFRLFVIPGMNHCTGGDGPFAVDYLSYLEAWVERGQAPDKLIGSHVRSGDTGAARPQFPLDPATVEFSRPIYPYPTRTKYLGRGDPKDASSFGPAEPRS